MYRIRPEQPVDVAKIHALHVESFPTDVAARLVDALRVGGRLPVSLVATDGDQLVGHLAFSPVRVGDAGGGLALGPLAVASEHQRHGVGNELVLAGLDACRTGGAGFVVVLCDPTYYSRFGFAPAARWGLVDERGGGPAFQALELRAGAIPVGAGLVHYAPDFAALGV